MTDSDEKVVPFTGITYLDFPPNTILKKAIKADLSEVVIIGYKKNGDMYFAGSKADGGTVLWLLEQAKKLLLDAI